MEEATAGCIATGPAWSININGPTILRERKGSILLTSNPVESDAFLASITMSNIRRVGS
jgi:hypothetical protein